MFGPAPGQQIVNTRGRMIGDAAEHVGEPGLWIDAVHLGRDDQAIHDRGTLSAAI